MEDTFESDQEKNSKKGVKGRAGGSFLNRERIVTEAIEFADANGIDKLSMRKLASRLGVEAMSLYHHINNKDDLLASMVDRVYDKLTPYTGGDWKSCLRERSLEVRSTLLEHPWTMILIRTSMKIGPGMLMHKDDTIRLLVNAGFPLESVGYCMSLIDSFIYGFLLQERCLPVVELGDVEVLLESHTIDEYRYLNKFLVSIKDQPDCDLEAEFQKGLAIVLDGLEAITRNKK